jgi:chaperonin GroEL
MKVIETKHRVEDANHATKHALLSGIVPGGGTDLLYASMKLKEYLDENINSLKYYEKLGLEMLISILKKPFFKLVKSCNLSCGVSEEKVLNKYREIKKLEYGIDVRTGDLINFIDKGILNPSAVSLGILNLLKEMMGLFIMCNVFIVDTPDEDKKLKEGFNPLR